jgi:hypothetical protein
MPSFCRVSTQGNEDIELRPMVEVHSSTVVGGSDGEGVTRTTLAPRPATRKAKLVLKIGGKL